MAKNGDAIKALREAMALALTNAREERARARELLTMAAEHEELASQLLDQIERLEERGRRNGHQ